MLCFGLLLVFCGMSFGHKAGSRGEVTLSDVYDKLSVLTRMTDMTLQACVNHIPKTIACPQPKKTISTTEYATKASKFGNQTEIDRATTSRPKLQFKTTTPAAKPTLHELGKTRHSVLKPHRRKYMHSYGADPLAPDEMFAVFLMALMKFCFRTHTWRQVASLTVELDLLRIDPVTRILYGAVFTDGCIGYFDQNTYSWNVISCGLFRGEPFEMAVSNNVMSIMERQIHRGTLIQQLRLNAETHHIISRTTRRTNIPVQGKLIHLSIDSFEKKMVICVKGDNSRRVAFVMMKTEGQRISRARHMRFKPIHAVTYDFSSRGYLVADDSTVIKISRSLTRIERLFHTQDVHEKEACLAATKGNVYYLGSNKMVVFEKATHNTTTVPLPSVIKPGLCAA